MHALIAALAGVLVVTSPTKSEACGMRHQTPFELFDRAHVVAFATVRKVPPANTAGDVELVVSRVVKGTKTAGARSR